MRNRGETSCRRNRLWKPDIFVICDRNKSMTEAATVRRTGSLRSFRLLHSEWVMIFIRLSNASVDGGSENFLVALGNKIYYSENTVSI